MSGEDKQGSKDSSNWNKWRWRIYAVFRSNVTVSWTASIRLLHWAAFVLRISAWSPALGPSLRGTGSTCWNAELTSRLHVWSWPTSHPLPQWGSGCKVGRRRELRPCCLPLCTQCASGTRYLCFLNVNRRYACANEWRVCWRPWRVHTQARCGWREKDPTSIWQRVRWYVHFPARRGVKYKDSCRVGVALNKRRFYKTPERTSVLFLFFRLLLIRYLYVCVSFSSLFLSVL
jgi:hypothetical protein